MVLMKEVSEKKLWRFAEHRAGMGDQRRFQEETQRDEMKVAETSLAADVIAVVWFAAAGLDSEAER